MKKALAIILSVLMLLPFVSCSNNPEQPDAPNAPEEPKYACLNRADADGDGVCDNCGIVRELSYADVVNELDSFESVALLPKINDTGAAATSYDRASYYNEETDTYVLWGEEMGGTWLSNSDGTGCIETRPDGSIVAADIKGSGVLVRSFFATAGKGDIEIYVDGKPTPVVDMPVEDFTQAEGKYRDLDNLVYVTDALGYNNYVPITFTSSLKIVLKKSWGRYFHFSYRLFDDHTVVEPTSAAFNGDEIAALKALNERLESPASAPVYADRESSVHKNEITVPAGQRLSVFETAGTAAISQFKFKINSELSELQLISILQKLEISMYWDGEESPSVWAPVGEFFANPGGKECYMLPMGKTADGWYYCNFYMPYRDGARVYLENLDSIDVNVALEVITVELARDISEYGRFHAKWSLNRFQPERADRPVDYVVLKTEGRGRFLGFNLHLLNNVDPDTPVSWWGEGDERFFVDGEKFPSTHGTGSEDYFGYAWCRGDFFYEAFHAQNWTPTMRGTPGDYNNVRFQLLDSIGFQNSFEASIEKTGNNGICQYMPTAYWYLEENGVDGYTPVKYEGKDAEYRYLSLTNLLAKQERQAKTNAIECEDMQVLEHWGIPLKMQTLYVTSYFLSNKRAFVFGSDDSVVEDGAYMIFAFEVQEDYEGPLCAYFGEGRNFGTARFYLDGELLDKEIDFYNSTTARKRSKMHTLEKNVVLKAGTHTLKVEMVDNDNGGNLFMFDCLVLGTRIGAKK